MVCVYQLVGRLPPEDLMAQLPSFLPALFDAFGNQSADVRKVSFFLHVPCSEFFTLHPEKFLILLFCFCWLNLRTQTVVFCLVDIYIVLGKAFLPYLGSLSSTQLRLVTIYANRISQV